MPGGGGRGGRGLVKTRNQAKDSDTSQSKTFRLTIVRRKDGAECLRTGHPGTKGHAWCNLDLRVLSPAHGAAGRGGEGEQGVTGLPTSVRMISSDFGSASSRGEREQRGQSERPLPAHRVCRRARRCSAVPALLQLQGLQPHSLLCGWPSSFGGKDQYWKS